MEADSDRFAGPARASERPISGTSEHLEDPDDDCDHQHLGTISEVSRKRKRRPTLVHLERCTGELTLCFMNGARDAFVSPRGCTLVLG
jgi:hypothetical protein